MKRALFFVTLPWTITMWMVAALSIVTGFATVQKWWTRDWCVQLVWRDWFARRWRFSTTLGRCIWLHPIRAYEIDNRVLRHELVHVRQGEDLMALSMMVGVVVWAVTGNAFLSLALWWSGGAWMLPNFLTAFARHGPKGVYRDSGHERAAYSETDEWPDGSSWDRSRNVRRAAQAGWLG